MASDPQLFRVTPEDKLTEKIQEVEFATLGLREVQDIQEWVAANPSILGDDLLIIAKEFRGFDRNNERLDLLAVDFTGALVIIELKRDDSGEDVHWQAIKYASYLREATPDFIVQRLAAYAEISLDESAERLLRHLGAEELSGLNHDQRIILASHRFAPEVTSAALWLNDKAPGDDLITCITLTPFRDPQTNALYVQANTIIPVPTASQYLIGVQSGPTVGDNGHNSSFGEKLSRRFAQNRNDDVSRFCWKVAELVIEELPSDVRPDKASRWANGREDLRFFNFWYSRPPWANYYLCHSFYLVPLQDSGRYFVAVSVNTGNDFVEQAVRQAAAKAEMQLETTSAHQFTLAKQVSALTDDCAEWVADELRRAITIITPVVDALPEEGNEAEV